jgi:hypothetical protein
MQFTDTQIFSEIEAALNEKKQNGKKKAEAGVS